MDSPTEQVPATAPDPLVGATLDGRYRIEGLIGRGGMAAVYRAADLALGRHVAVKVFSSATEGIDDADRRRSETALLASLTHPALVTLFDAANDPETHREFLVMELVEGPDLREVLRSGPIPGADATRMLADLAEGLHVIHSRGIVHRDVKPANVLLASAHLPTRRWHAKLADFGIARLLDESRLTATGRIIGTPGYLSPEQVRGEPVGSSADIYSLGLLMLEALTGEQPFPGPALESASARLVRDPVIPAALGAEWVGLLTAMSAREPSARPSALDVALAAQSLDAPAGRPTTEQTLLLPATTPAAGAPNAFADDDTRITTVPAHSGDDATAATRVLPAAAPSGIGEVDPAPGPRRMPRWLAPAAIAGVLLAVLAVLVPSLIGGLGGAGDASGSGTEPSPTPMPSVPGDLGTHLQQLEEAVSE
ncbi:protein kinase [Agromyces aurantiacus]|uniref:Protein kinase n=1 Tax=Agromyces aurantiacus TaxID=165814 RepID=A0ABV9R1J1_9MICO|nr:serine/threonine-protein kinase [Agromyces aurantiacus]MBM7502636.1 serine/threonine protein kinase [Agromyces aurantiacus]